MTEDWDARIEDLWTRFDDYDEDAFVARVEALAAELAPDDPRGAFERAAAQDSTGRSDLAVPLYQLALDGGVTGLRRRRAAIQLASSLRNIGDVGRGVDILTAERDRASDDLDDAVLAFLALMLVDSGREREAVSISLGALAPHLTRYQRSVGNYARLLIEDEDDA